MKKGLATVVVSNAATRSRSADPESNLLLNMRQSEGSSFSYRFVFLPASLGQQRDYVLGVGTDLA